MTIHTNVSRTATAVANLRQMRALADSEGTCVVDAYDLELALDALELFESMPLSEHAAVLKRVVDFVAPEARTSLDWEGPEMRGHIGMARGVLGLIVQNAPSAVGLDTSP